MMEIKAERIGRGGDSPRHHEQVVAMSSIESFLTEDHRQCDLAFVEAERLVARGHWQEATGQLTQFADALQRHFAREEDVLFPAFEAATGSTSGPTAVMRMEHRQMNGLLDALREAAARRDRDDCLGHLETLLMLMQQHNAKEEHILYPMADRALGDDAAGLVERIRAR